MLLVAIDVIRNFIFKLSSWHLTADNPHVLKSHANMNRIQVKPPPLCYVLTVSCVWIKVIKADFLCFQHLLMAVIFDEQCLRTSQRTTPSSVCLVQSWAEKEEASLISDAVKLSVKIQLSGRSVDTRKILHFLIYHNFKVMKRVHIGTMIYFVNEKRIMKYSAVFWGKAKWRQCDR